ncbi:MAG: hypothetical protein WEK74_15070, partial [Hydrogenophaga sp.]
HTFAAAGTFTVKLTVIDTAGRVGTTSDKVTVKPAVVVDPVGTTAPLNVSVRGADGALLSGASVTIGSQTATTSNAGFAGIAQAAVGDDQVLRVSSPGFITQVLSLDLVAGSTPLEVGVRLLAVKETIAIQQAQEAQVLLAKSLGASVTLPANALVNASGAIATGPITLQLTPWNIDGDDLLAMPGNGEALDAEDMRTSLISAGMLTVDFFDAVGGKLQLASTARAVIQMDLPYTSINGQSLSVGTPIPMWNFDEASGLWLEDGVGEVISSQSSPTGLALQATVSHFSTWNWDFKFDNPGSVVVSCVNASGEPVACSVVATVTLEDGSRITRGTNLGLTPTTVINMPSAGSIEWQATTAGGLQGFANSGTSGTVVISIAPPTTNNFVQCRLPGGAAVACSVTLTGTENNGTASTRSYALPAEGATIQTTLLASAPLTWNSESVRRNTDQTTTRNTGTAVSGSTGPVVVQLSTAELLTDRTVRLQCDPEVDVFDGQTEQFTVVPLASCNLRIQVFSNGFSELLLDQSLAVSTGVPVNVTIPPSGVLSVGANGVSGSVFLNGFLQRGYNDIVDNAVVILRLARGFLVDVPVLL